MARNSLTRETKRDKFVRLAEQRMNVIVEQFRKLRNLSNTKNYDYNEEDVKKILAELSKGLRNIKVAFTENNNTKPKRFKL